MNYADMIAEGPYGEKVKVPGSVGRTEVPKSTARTDVPNGAAGTDVPNGDLHRD